MIYQLFNNFFTKFAAELKADIPASNIDSSSLVSCIEALVILYPVSVEESTNLISKLKNTKTGFNQLRVKFYKTFENILSPIISSFTNFCFSTGTFPQLLKSVIATHIFKKYNGIFLFKLQTNCQSACSVTKSWKMNLYTLQQFLL